MRKIALIIISLLISCFILSACSKNEDLAPIDLEAESEPETPTIAAPASIDLDSIIETEPTTEATEPETQEPTTEAATKAKETKKETKKAKETKKETKAETEAEASPEGLTPIDTPQPSDTSTPQPVEDSNASGPSGSSSSPIVPEGGEITIVEAGPGSN